MRRLEEGECRVSWFGHRHLWRPDPSHRARTDMMSRKRVRFHNQSQGDQLLMTSTPYRSDAVVCARKLIPIRVLRRQSPIDNSVAGPGLGDTGMALAPSPLSIDASISPQLVEPPTATGHRTPPLALTRDQPPSRSDTWTRRTPAACIELQAAARLPPWSIARLASSITKLSKPAACASIALHPTQ